MLLNEFERSWMTGDTSSANRLHCFSAAFEIEHAVAIPLLVCVTRFVTRCENLGYFQMIQANNSRVISINEIRGMRTLED